MLEIDEKYVEEIRQKLHMYPEIGFELPKTLELVKTELDRMGVAYTEKYGKSSIVAVVNDEKSRYTIGIRADMDALPIKELNEIPYKSRIEGQMHACGHDVHTAILLGTVKEINEMRDKINCRIKFLFQPAEEFAPPGALLMVEDGVMEDIDCIVACHVEPAIDAGTVSIDAGGQGANSLGFTIELFGKNAHAAYQNKGIDAIAMGVKVYVALEFMIAREIDPTVPCVLNIGAFNAGITNNIVADYCRLYGTVRTHSDEVSDYIYRRIEEITQSVSGEMGGSGKVTQAKFLPYVVNDEKVCEELRITAKKVVGAEKILSRKRTMGGEDFSFYTRIKPGAMFRLGVRNEEKGITKAVHNGEFNVDEACYETGVRMFVQYVLDNMDKENN